MRIHRAAHLPRPPALAHHRVEHRSHRGGMAVRDGRRVRLSHAHHSAVTKPHLHAHGTTWANIVCFDARRVQRTATSKRAQRIRKTHTPSYLSQAHVLRAVEVLCNSTVITKHNHRDQDTSAPVHTPLQLQKGATGVQDQRHTGHCCSILGPLTLRGATDGGVVTETLLRLPVLHRLQNPQYEGTQSHTHKHRHKLTHALP